MTAPPPGRLDQLADALRRHGPLALLGVLTAVVAAVYAPVFAGEPAGDDNTFHLAEIARLAEAMRQGDWDWWNPAGNAGYAAGYYYQVLPQAGCAAAAALLGLSPLLAFQLGIWLPLVLAPAAAYRALRVLGGDPWQALGAAIALPFAVGASRWGHGADGVLLVGLFTQLWATVALPLALAHGARWLGRGRGLAPALGWGLAAGLSHPFVGVSAGVALAAFAGVEVAGRGAARRRWWRPVARLATLGGLLVVGAACAWAPVVVDYDGFGGFPHRVADEVGPGVVGLLGWLWRGELLDAGRPAVLTLLLLPVAALARAPFLGRLWAAAAALALLLALGRVLGKTEDDLLPAVRLLGALQVVLALAVGAGAATLARRAAALPLPGALAERARLVAAGLAALAAVVVVLGGAATQRARVRVAADYPSVGIADLRALMPAVRAAAPGRLQVRAGAENHWAIQLPYVEAGRPAGLVMGGASLQSSPSFAFLYELRDRDAARAARLFDAPLVLVRTQRAAELPDGALLAETPTYQLRRLPSPGLVGPVRVVGALPAGRAAARRAALDWLRSDAALAGDVLAYPGPGGGPPTPAAAPPPGAPADATVHAVRRGGSWIEADVEVAAGGPTTLVVRESWHPRWRATVDGAPVPVRRVTPSFLAVDVPPGAHALRLAFARPWWSWALWALPLLLVLLAAAVTARRRADDA